jgi:hypothetical protein
LEDVLAKSSPDSVVRRSFRATNALSVSEGRASGPDHFIAWAERKDIPNRSRMTKIQSADALAK